LEKRFNQLSFRLIFSKSKIVRFCSDSHLLERADIALIVCRWPLVFTTGAFPFSSRSYALRNGFCGADYIRFSTYSTV